MGESDMSKKRIAPKVCLTTQDFPDIMRREYTLAYTFEVHVSYDARELLRLNSDYILASLKISLNREIKEWCGYEG